MKGNSKKSIEKNMKNCYKYTKAKEENFERYSKLEGRKKTK